MQVTLSLLVAFAGVFASTAAAAASPAAEPKRAPPSCVVPEVFFFSLPDAFTLSALVPGRSPSTQQLSWPVQLSPRQPTEDAASIPFISRTKILPPSFKLVNQTLVTADGGIPAHLEPTIAIFPPTLQPFAFGGPDASPAKFGAAYACDSTGKQILTLRADRAPGFAVNKVAEGEQVFIRPEQFAGEAVDVSLRIDNGK